MRLSIEVSAPQDPGIAGTYPRTYPGIYSIMCPRITGTYPRAYAGMHIPLKRAGNLPRVVCRGDAGMHIPLKRAGNLPRVVRQGDAGETLTRSSNILSRESRFSISFESDISTFVAPLV
jgi:hypothetical protein